MRHFNHFCRTMVVVLASGCAPAGAQPVYRCANLYSDAPCPDAVMVDTNDTRTPEQKAHSDRTTRQTTALAERLARDREVAQRAPGPPGTSSRPRQAASAPRATEARAGAPKPKPPSRQPADQEPFVATVRTEKPAPTAKAAPPAATRTAASKP